MNAFVNIYHHMFTVGMDIDSRSYFSIATSIISIPTSVKIFSYMNTWASGRGFKGSNSSWSFFSFIICFTFGGFTGLLLSSANLDILLHDTYFVVGHFHTVLSLARVTYDHIILLLQFLYDFSIIKLTTIIVYIALDSPMNANLYSI